MTLNPLLPPIPPTIPPTLYWNYVLGYEIRQTDHFCQDIALTTSTLYWNNTYIMLQMKSPAHTIFVMTTTLPHAPTLYWNYVLGYK